MRQVVEDLYTLSNKARIKIRAEGEDPIILNPDLLEDISKKTWTIQEGLHHGHGGMRNDQA